MNYVGLDLGQAMDYTALAVIEQGEAPAEALTTAERKASVVCYLRALDRCQLGTPYPEIVSRVATILANPKLDAPELVVDATGVGRPVIDMFRAKKIRPLAVTITGGDKVTKEGAEWRVPKGELVSVAVVLLQSGRLKIAPTLKLGSLLAEELRNFRVKITANAHASYNARDGEHDDLILAVALACWRATSRVSGPAYSHGYQAGSRLCDRNRY